MISTDGCSYALSPSHGPIASGVRALGIWPMHVSTWEDGEHRFPVKRARERVTECMLHETVTTSLAATVRAINSRKLGVQFIVAPDGSVSQHGDAVTDMQEHVGSHNGAAVGIEVVTPYYPTGMPAGGPWRDVLEAPWAHRGRYVVPTLEQAESTCLLVSWMTAGTVPGLDIPREWVGLRNGQWRMTQLTPSTPRPGIWSHQQVGGHADGSWLALYSWLRLAVGMGPLDARAEAVVLATGSRGVISVAHLLPTT